MKWKTLAHSNESSCSSEPGLTFTSAWNKLLPIVGICISSCATFEAAKHGDATAATALILALLFAVCVTLSRMK